MRLSEWRAATTNYAGFGEGFARRAAATTLQGLFASEDPLVFGSTTYGQEESDPFVVTLLAPFNAGLAKATVTHNPRTRVSPRVEVVVRPWLGMGETLRLAVDGDPEEEPLPVTVAIDGVEFVSTRFDRTDLLAFFEAVAALAR